MIIVVHEHYDTFTRTTVWPESENDKMVLYDNFLKRIDLLISQVDGRHWTGDAELLRCIRARVEAYKASPMPYDNQLADLLDVIIKQIAGAERIVP